MEQELIALQAELYELKKSIYTTSKNDYSMFSSVGQSAAYQQVCDLLKKQQVPKFPFCCKVKHVSEKKPLLVVYMN